MQPTCNLTDFQKAVYDAVRKIPCGKVSTYGDIALEISRGTARSVGTALAKNPFAPEVPCHRVVRSNGGLGGYFGATQGESLARKEAILRTEGVEFSLAGKVAMGSILNSADEC